MQHVDRIAVRDNDRRGNLGENAAVRQSSELIPLLVDGAMVVAAEHGEVRERCWPSLGPVANVMALAEAHVAAREAAATVAVVERAAQGWRNRSRPGGYFHYAAIAGVPHHHTARVHARRRDVSAETCSPLEHGLA